jgi:hypothetical protein
MNPTNQPSDRYSLETRIARNQISDCRSCGFVPSRIISLRDPRQDETFPNASLRTIGDLDPAWRAAAESRKEELGNRRLTGSAVTILRAYLATFCRRDVRAEGRAWKSVVLSAADPGDPSRLGDARRKMGPFFRFQSLAPVVCAPGRTRYEFRAHAILAVDFCRGARTPTLENPGRLSRYVPRRFRLSSFSFFLPFSSCPLLRLLLLLLLLSSHHCVVLV